MMKQAKYKIDDIQYSNNPTNWDSLISDNIGKNQIIISIITTETIASNKGSPVGAYGYGRLITICSAYYYTSIQIYIPAPSNSDRIYYRTGAGTTGDKWNVIVRDAVVEKN